MNLIVSKGFLLHQMYRKANTKASPGKYTPKKLAANRILAHM